jgi:hypothetical protein
MCGVAGALAAGAALLIILGLAFVPWLAILGAATLTAAFVLWDTPRTGLTRRQRLVRRILITIAAAPVLLLGIAFGSALLS